MFVSKKIVYLQVQKTGSTHVTAVLRQFCGGKLTTKHDQLKDASKFADRVIASSVRNPWDWYVSLWAYGCAGKGGLHKYLTQSRFSELRNAWRNRDFAAMIPAAFRGLTQFGRPDWKKLYSDHSNEENFRTWLKLMLGPEGRRITKEGFAASGIKDFTGFMTFRFLALTTDYKAWMSTGRFSRNYEELKAFAEKNMVARVILRTETLNADLHKLLVDTGHDVSMEAIEAIGKTNTSTHRKYDSYFDEETTRLVMERDRYIIEHFGYGLFTEPKKQAAAGAS